MIKKRCDCGNPLELLKVKDEVWAVSGFAPGTTPCTACLERAIGRQLVESDVDFNFPWWGVDRPIYYAGIRDGLAGQPQSSSDGEYLAGYTIGTRIASND